MFGHEAEPDTRNYRYGARAPVENAHLVEEQFRRAHAYRNALVEIERDRRTRGNAAIEAAFPTVREAAERAAALEEAKRVAHDALRAVHQSNRSRRGDDDERAAYKNAKLAFDDACKAATKARREASASEVGGACWARVNAEANERVKAERARCGLYWGTYLLVERSVPRAGPPPRFRRWTGDGQLGVQIQGGMQIEDVCKDDGRARLESMPSGARRTDQYTRLWFRVGSTGARGPIMACMPIRLHRPLPIGSRLKWVYVQRRRIAAHYRWHVVFVLAHAPDVRETAPDGVVAINCGWRRLDDGVRVAYARDGDGREEQLVIANEDLSRWEKADGLRSVRDRNFNVARDVLRGWLASHAHPEWLRERCSTIYSWKSCARLASVALAWREERFEGDAEIFAALESWRKQDKHLWEWESNQRRKAVAWRDTSYRTWADRMAKRYRAVVPGLVDYDRLARRADADEDDESTKASRGNRFDAAPGRLVQFLRERFAETIDVPSKDITQRCSECLKRDAFDAAGELVRTCAKCGATLDQDSRACRNLLRLVEPELARAAT